MPLKFTPPSTLPGITVEEITDIPLVEIRNPDSITFWYTRRSAKGIDQLHLTLTLPDLKKKYPADYAAVFNALKKVGYQEAVDGRLAPSGGTVS